ncbi:MAG: MarR family transcriptional regulator [Patulibacter sp.]
MAAERSTPELLNRQELAAWRGMLRTYTLLQRELETRLEARDGLQNSSYEVLMHLSDAPEGRMRLSDLAALAILSRSGLTRLIDRLEREGHVERERCPEDARGYFAVLTDEGRARVDAARGEYLQDVRTLFLEQMTSEERDVLGSVWARVLAELEPGLEP